MNPFLHGNGKKCRACNGTGKGPGILMHKGEFESAGKAWPSETVYGPCATCRGTGRVAKTAREIIRDTKRARK